MSPVHYSSKTAEWGTPPEIFAAATRGLRPVLDVCATAKNSKCKTYLAAPDGLETDWHSLCIAVSGAEWGVDRRCCWMNPPYGRGIGAWVKKAYETARQGTAVVCLLPARTDTAWWHDYCAKASRVEFIRGRIKFLLPDGKTRHPAPFPSVIVVFQ